MKKLFKKADILLVLFFCLLCAAMLLPGWTGSNKLAAVVYENGQVTHRIELNNVRESYTIELGGSPASIILVEHNAIRYLSAECRDKLCVKAGSLRRKGNTAACLPAKTVIVIESAGRDKNEPDVITY